MQRVLSTSLRQTAASTSLSITQSSLYVTSYSPRPSNMCQGKQLTQSNCCHVAFATRVVAVRAAARGNRRNLGRSSIRGVQRLLLRLSACCEAHGGAEAWWLSDLPQLGARSKPLRTVDGVRQLQSWPRAHGQRPRCGPAWTRNIGQRNCSGA